MWTKEQLKEIVRTKKFAVVVASVVSLASGSAGGYLVATKRLEKQFDERLEVEIQQTKDYYSALNKTGDFSDPSKLAEKYNDIPADEILPPGLQPKIENLEEVVEKLNYAVNRSEPQDVTETIEVRQSISKNIFANRSPVEDDEDVDVAAEMAARDTDFPYIITHDEFYENIQEYNEISLTYFEGDDVLLDDADKPIQNVSGTIGENNLRFGHLSKDANIVYIRNDKLGANFEVARSDGKYTEQVLGFFEHSDKRGLRKFRLDE